MAQQVGVSDADYSLLREIARRQGKTIEDVLAETIGDLRQTVTDQRAFWGDQFEKPVTAPNAQGSAMSETEFDALLDASAQQPTGSA